MLLRADMRRAGRDLLACFIRNYDFGIICWRELGAGMGEIVGVLRGGKSEERLRETDRPLSLSLLLLLLFFFLPTIELKACKDFFSLSSFFLF